MSKRSGKKRSQEGPVPAEMDRARKVQEKEDILMGYLSPIETSVVTFQNVLVWENPRHSAVLFVIVHILFWLATTVRVYYVVGITGTIIVAVDMWKNHIWPEIRVPLPPDHDEEDWTPVHPKLLSVPEICLWLAEWWVYLTDTIQAAINLRKHNHSKFFLYAVTAFSFMAAVGCYIPGLLIAYISVLLFLLYPCMLYHDGWHKINLVLQPVLSGIEQKLNIKRERKSTIKDKHRHGATPATKIDQSDSDSEELQEFVPKVEDPKIEMTLAKAESESDDDDGFIPGLLTPPHISSQGASREHSDVEDSCAGDLGSLASGLGEIPSYDDTLDAADNNEKNDLNPDDLSQEVDLVTSDQTACGPSDQEAIQFVSSHFSQFSEEEADDSPSDQTVSGIEPEEDIIKELSENISAFPDVDEDSAEATTTQVMMASGVKLLSSHGQALVSHGQALVSAIGATNVTGLMATTVAGFSSIRDTVSAVVHTSHDSDTVSAVVHTSHDSAGEENMTDSIDSKQLEAEFEFLDEEDLSHND